MMPLPDSNINAVITNNFALFRSLPSLQEQNSKTTRDVREFGAKIESEERDAGRLIRSGAKPLTKRTR